jgi:CHAT domain-containing protein/tetratricopeptide (TPR) repeat protein
MYRNLGQYQKAIDFFQQSLTIQKQISNRNGEGLSLNNLGLAYNSLGQHQKAIEYYQQSLAIQKQIGNRNGEATSINNLGGAYNSLGQYQKAIEYYQQSLAIQKQIGNRNGEATSINNLGGAYNSLGQYQKAIEYYQQSLAIQKQIGNRNGEATSINNLGLAYAYLGQYQKAIEYYQQSLAITKQIGDRNGEARSINNLGAAYRSLGQYQKAIEYYQQSLAIQKQIGDRNGEAASLNNLGGVYDRLGQYQKAIEYFQQSLAIKKQIGDRNGEAVSINNLGLAYYRLGQYQKAIEYFQQSLAIKKQIGDRTGEGASLNNLAVTFGNLNQPALAIIFYKQAVNTYETIRQDIRGLPKELQNSYKETVAGSYRQLADLLLQQNRVLEAQRVLDLLKVQELDEFLRGVRGNTNTERGIENLPPEQQINQGYQKLIDQAVAIGKELTELRSIKPKERTIAQDQRIAQLDTQETELVKAFTKFIDSDEVKTLLKKLEAIAFNQQDLLGRLSEFNALQANLRNLQQEAVLLYPLILENRLELVLVTPYSPPIRRTVNVTSKELNQTIVEFRSALQNSGSDATKPAQKLYDWLIKPIEKDLETANTKTIIYAPDGQLRYIPLAALHDGKQWLVERYRVNNITAASLTDLNTKPQRELSVLAGAYTTSGKKHNFAIGDEQFNFAGLPYAEMEVSKLAETISETTQLRDEGFSFKATKPKMDDYAIVHFATHAAFLKGQPEKSFILFGNGDRISLTDIKEGAFGALKKVDLFVLSACETGVGGNFGTGAEILGFGYLMQTTGARAAIASLWKVNDSGTQALMNTFYATLANNAITKAEALRQAQIALITGNYKTVAGSRGQMVAIEQRIRQGLPNDVANNLSHPYYWSSFILIGNGL